MLKTLGAQIKEFKKASAVTPIFMIAEVIMEMIIPLLMASIIDDGVNGNGGSGDMNHIKQRGHEAYLHRGCADDPDGAAEPFLWHRRRRVWR